MSIGFVKQSSASVPTPPAGEMNTFIDSADDKLKRKDSTNTVVSIEDVASGVATFEGRSGVVVGVAGDYTASEITNVPAGDISAATVQAAITELDAEKAPITHVGSNGVSEHAVATGAVAGFMSPSDFTKLAGVATGATANDTDANLKNRANHTGVQSATTISTGLVSDAEFDRLDGVTSPIQTQFSGKEPTITATSAADYYRGDKTFQVLDKTAVGLANVDNTSDATKNAAAVTLTNKTINGSLNTITNVSLTTGVAGVLPLANGGTNQATALAARGPSGLNIDQRTAVSNADATIVATDRYVAQTGTMSAPRTFTLPLANSVNAGQPLYIIDESGTVTSTNTLSIARAGADTINNSASSIVIRSAYGRAVLYSDGTSKWTDAVTGVSRGGTGLTTLPTDGQLLIGGTAAGTYTQAALTAGAGINIINSAGGIQVVNSAAANLSLPLGMMGDGIDGSPTIAGPITLTRDMFYDSPTINAAVNTGGFVIFWKGTLTIGAAGSITRNGNNGSTPTSGAGAAGAALAGVTTGTTGAGGAGGAGAIGNGANGATSGAISGEGGAGGVGGNGGQGNAGATTGGSGGNTGVLTIRYFRNVQHEWKYTAVGTFMPTACGGGGGGAGGGDGVVLGRGGGGGGGGGGGILLIGNVFVNNGSVQAKGGNGGNGGTGASGNCGGGSGGGGGGGGKIMLIANTITTRGTLDDSGGAAGSGSAGAGTGVAGSAGGAGATGYATSFEASTQTWSTT